MIGRITSPNGRIFLLRLNPVPNAEWQKKYDRLMANPYLSKKYNRKKRLRDHQLYIDNLSPEVKRCKGKLIVDVGSAMGEYLELCRGYGHNVLGVDAPLNNAEMGDAYIQMSKLMTQRQEIPVYYIGFEKWLDENNLPDESVYLINMRGSINQCFAKYLQGPSHRDTKDSSLQKWDMSPKLWDAMYKMFEEYHRILEDGGYIVIHANGSANNPQYDSLILETLKKFPTFKLYYKKGKTLHKVRKEL
jgi:SAM-dependent methyltransferase